MTQLEASAAAAELTVENERLRAELRARLEELRSCRRRMVEAIQSERRQIERDLHDGTQGRLVSLAISLGLLEAKLPRDADAARPMAREARPAALDAAAYFLVSEALTNAVKHADATQVRVEVAIHEDRLVIEIADDGKGGAIPGAGSGLPGLVERIEGLGGRLLVSSPPRRGTTIRAELRCREGTAAVPGGSTTEESCSPAGRAHIEVIDSRTSRAPSPHTQPQQMEHL